MRAMCPARLILLYLITGALTVSGEEYKLSSSLRNFLHPLVISCFYCLRFISILLSPPYVFRVSALKYVTTALFVSLSTHHLMD
jgi:hypothetical protein